MKRLLPLIIAIAMIVTFIPVTTGVAFGAGEDLGIGIIDLTKDQFFYYDDEDDADYYEPALITINVMGENGDIGKHPKGLMPASTKRYFDLDNDGQDDMYEYFEDDTGKNWIVKCPDTNLTGHYILWPSRDSLKELANEEYYDFFGCLVIAFDKVGVKTGPVTGLAKSKIWTGKAIKPSFKLWNQGRQLKKGTDYTVTYSNNTKVGKAKVTIKGKGIFEGTRTEYFKINPKGTSISSISPLKKGFKVVWKKQASQTSGYQVRYANNSKFKNYKTKTVSGATKTSRSVTKLAYKKYWVKVRTYKTVNGTKYYSKWSDVKTVSPRQ